MCGDLYIELVILVPVRAARHVRHIGEVRRCRRHGETVELLLRSAIERVEVVEIVELPCRRGAHETVLHGRNAGKRVEWFRRRTGEELLRWRIRLELLNWSDGFELLRSRAGETVELLTGERVELSLREVVVEGLRCFAGEGEWTGRGWGEAELVNRLLNSRSWSGRETEGTFLLLNWDRECEPSSLRGGWEREWSRRWAGERRHELLLLNILINSRIFLDGRCWERLERGERLAARWRLNSAETQLLTGLREAVERAELIARLNSAGIRQSVEVETSKRLTRRRRLTEGLLRERTEALIVEGDGLLWRRDEFLSGFNNGCFGDFSNGVFLLSRWARRADGVVNVEENRGLGRRQGCGGELRQERKAGLVHKGKNAQVKLRPTRVEECPIPKPKQSNWICATAALWSPPLTGPAPSYIISAQNQISPTNSSKLNDTPLFFFVHDFDEERWFEMISQSRWKVIVSFFVKLKDPAMMKCSGNLQKRFTLELTPCRCGNGRLGSPLLLKMLEKVVTGGCGRNPLLNPLLTGMNPLCTGEGRNDCVTWKGVTERSSSRGSSGVENWRIVKGCGAWIYKFLYLLLNN